MQTKTFDQLNEDVRVQVLETTKQSIVHSIIEDGLAFEELEKYQDKIDHCLAEANALETPWFAHEYLYEAIGKSKGMKKAFETLAVMIAKNSLYADAGTRVVTL